MTLVLNLLPLLSGNKFIHMKIKILTPLFIIFFFFNQYILSQKYYPVVKKNGDFWHEINIYQGLTLYSLSQKINCSTDDIIRHNPGASAGLSLGEKIYFPLARKTLRHKVLSKESLYSLSQDYLISIDSIISWNPGSESGIQIGNDLVIKNGAVRLLSETSSKTIDAESNLDNKIEINKDDGLISHVVVKGESVYGIAKRYMVPSDKICELNGINPNQIRVGSVLKIPLKNTIDVSQNEKPISVDKNGKPVFKPIVNPKIAIFLPFGADTVKKTEAIHKFLLNLYVGMSLGMQDFTKYFKSAEFTYYDYYSPKVKLDSVLLSEKMANMNLVYAPVIKADAEKISDFCKAHQIPVIILQEFNSPSIQSNPFAYQLPMSGRTEAIFIANSLYGMQKGHQIVLVRSESKEAYEIEEEFLLAYRSLFTSPQLAKVIETDTSNFMNVVDTLLPTYYVSFVNQPAEVRAILKRT